jgi:hypothetical protein
VCVDATDGSVTAIIAMPSCLSLGCCFRHAGFYVDTGFTEEDEMSVKQWVLSQKIAQAELDEVDLYHWTKNYDISDFEGYDLTEYEKIDEEIEVAEFPDDSEIVRLTTEQEENENCIQNETDEDAEADAFPSAQEALAALQTVTRFVRLSLPEEDHSNFLESSSILEKNLYKRMLKKRFQSKITDFFSLSWWPEHLPHSSQKQLLSNPTTASE